MFQLVFIFSHILNIYINFRCNASNTRLKIGDDSDSPIEIK
jgi:hypothetical protein